MPVLMVTTMRGAISGRESGECLSLYPDTHHVIIVGKDNMFVASNDTIVLDI